MPEGFRQILPSPPPADIFATYQLTHQFYQEAQARQDFQAYCEWYRETAKRHQQEFKKMQNDMNLLGWFCRRRH